MIRSLLPLLVVCFVGDAVASNEPRTGISFPDQHKGGVLQRLGVRTKGPIKVYAVGQYDNGNYMLKMSYGVGAEKMTSALADALGPRCSDAKQIEAFKACLLAGLPDGAPKGTTMLFATGGGKLSVSVNNKNVGSAGGKALCNAFAGIYTDKNAVCSLYDVDGDESSAGHGLLTAPRVGALVGAALGYSAGKVLA